MPSFDFQDLSIYTPSTFNVFRSICNDFFEELASETDVGSRVSSFARKLVNTRARTGDKYSYSSPQIPPKQKNTFPFSRHSEAVSVRSKTCIDMHICTCVQNSQEFERMYGTSKSLHPRWKNDCQQMDDRGVSCRICYSRDTNSADQCSGV